MSFKISCPHCAKALNVTEPAFGKTVPCPGCNQPIKVPIPAQPLRQASPVGPPPPPWSGVAQNGASTPGASEALAARNAAHTRWRPASAAPERSVGVPF